VSAEGPAGSGGPAGLRVLTWNVHDLLGDPLAVTAVLRSAAADVVCLQEAPRLARSRYKLASLARSAGLLFVAGGREAAGAAVLCSMRAVVTGEAAMRLPTSGLRTRPRGLVHARVGLPGTAALHVASVHLGLSPEERARHAALVVELMSASGGAAVVAGDLNEPPGGPAWSALSAVATDPSPAAGRTFPARAPDRRLDAVLTGPAVTVLEYGTWHPDEELARRASDHLPVLAVLSPPAH
jgi:endonuclease/exonuclease/phosphatase family metal-dependent hydrolase